MTSHDPVDPDHQPQAAAIDPEMPILLQPVPPPKWPKVISTVRALTGVQVALVMICGNCSFGWPLASAIAWVVERFNWHEDATIAIPWAWGVGFAAISTYAYFTNRWAGRGGPPGADHDYHWNGGAGRLDRCNHSDRVRYGTGWNFVLFAAVPSLILQAIVLWCVFGREGRRWFARKGVEPVAPGPLRLW